MDAEDIKKIIPTEKVYDDALSPAMKQIGVALKSVVKTSRFLLAPFDYLAMQHDRWERYLEKVSDKVPTENLTEGHPQIVIPTLEGLSLSYENTLLSEFFINLLANTIDNRKQDLAHPAFPNIIKQISHDEAVILFYLKKKTYTFTECKDFNKTKTGFINIKIEENDFPINKLLYPDNIVVYLEHLNSLNIAEIKAVADQKDPIINNEKGEQISIHLINERKLTTFGKLFAKSCVPETFEDL